MQGWGYHSQQNTTLWFGEQEEQSKVKEGVGQSLYSSFGKIV